MIARLVRVFGRLRRKASGEDPWLDLPWEDKPEDMPDGTTNRARLGHRFRDGMDTIHVQQRGAIDEEDGRVARRDPERQHHQPVDRLTIDPAPPASPPAPRTQSHSHRPATPRPAHQRPRLR